MKSIEGYYKFQVQTIIQEQVCCETIWAKTEEEARKKSVYPHNEKVIKQIDFSREDIKEFILKKALRLELLKLSNMITEEEVHDELAEYIKEMFCEKTDED